MSTTILARNLTKTFPGGAVGVTGLDLEIEAGTVYGLVGRNGAGKTTALRLLMGLLKPDEGQAQVLGWDLWYAPRQVRGRISYVSQNEQMPGWMALRDLCRYSSGFYDRWNPSWPEALAKKWEVPWTRPLATLSGGEQRKAALILALAPEPDVLLLDEPAGGLDPVSRRELVEEIIATLNRNTAATVLFATHILSDLERIAEQVGMLERGRLVLNRSVDELQSSWRRVQVIFPGEMVPPRFTIRGAMNVTISGPVVSGVTEYFDVEHIEALRQWPGVRVQVFPLGLEEIFLEIARRNEKPEHGNSEVAEDEGKILCL